MMGDYSLSETETERQELLDELAADRGPTWAEQYKPGSYGCHELLDRTSLAADMVERQVSSHPACVQNPDWFALACQAAAILSELYQRIGAEHLTADAGDTIAPSNGSAGEHSVRS